MNYLYIVNYWEPFPTSEYGGVVSVIAKNDQECHDLLRDGKMSHDSKYDNKIMQCVITAHKFELMNEETSRIIDSFIT